MTDTRSKKFSPKMKKVLIILTAVVAALDILFVLASLDVTWHPWLVLLAFGLVLLALPIALLQNSKVKEMMTDTCAKKWTKVLISLTAKITALDILFVLMVLVTYKWQPPVDEIVLWFVLLAFGLLLLALLIALANALWVVCLLLMKRWRDSLLVLLLTLVLLGSSWGFVFLFKRTIVSSFKVAEHGDSFGPHTKTIQQTP